MVANLSIKMVVASHHQLSDSLVSRKLGLLVQGDAGEVILETVRAYLRQGTNIIEAAKALKVHPNTVRYRLERFQELSGSTFESVESLFEIWIALERLYLEKEGRPFPADNPGLDQPL